MTSTTFNLLIAGTSHVGKSTLSAAIGVALDVEVLSTDKMASHPGRPWPKVRPHIAEFYSVLSHDSIFLFLLNHHKNMWPSIKRTLLQHQVSEKKCIIEGCALRPEYIKNLSIPENLCVCLHAPPDFLRQRIHFNCGYVGLTDSHQSVVDTFVERTIRDNSANVVAAKEWNIECIDASDLLAVRDVQNRLIECLRSGQQR
jgi:2-phosphoglycerate kinase